MSIKTFYIQISTLWLVLIMTPLGLMSQSESDQGPYFATGIRIGDVSQTEAVIWARLTKNKKRVNVKTGAAMEFEILLVSPMFERIALPFTKNLERL